MSAVRRAARPRTGGPEHPLLAAVRLDVLTVVPYARQLLLLFAVAAFIGGINEAPVVVVPLCVVYAALAATYPFHVAERHRLDSLHAVLPMRRSTFVLGRYLTGVLMLALGVVTGGVLTLAIGAVTGGTPAPAEMALAVCGSLAVAGTAVALQLPVLVRFGYSRGRLVALVPFGLLLAVGGLVLPDLRLDALPEPLVLGPALVAGTALVLTASAALALRLDGGRTG